MSDDLTDADLDRMEQRQEVTLHAHDLLAEVRRLRAVVGAHPTGPDQDEPAAPDSVDRMRAERAMDAVQKVMQQASDYLARAKRAEGIAAEALERNVETSRALDEAEAKVARLRAREAQATAPRADEAAPGVSPGLDASLRGQGFGFGPSTALSDAEEARVRDYEAGLRAPERVRLPRSTR